MSPTIYLVGGAVRDKLLNRASNDKDYVVVGATPEWMTQQGYKQVGASFPVFLHPESGEEYALARQERKNGHGYHGFEVTYDSSVTLEDDLLRRDLTINSMAMDKDGNLIDPFGGQHDLSQGILRHTSESFADDPLRVLRLARFAARYQFKVADETIALAKKLVDAGELDYLPSSRIWMEIRKGLEERNPIRMIKVLEEVGALSKSVVKDYFPESTIDLKSWLSVVFKWNNHSIDTKFLLVMGAIADDHKDFETKARQLSIPSYYSKMATKYCYLAKFLLEGELTPQEVFQIFSNTKFLQEYENEDYRSVIETLQIEEEHTGRRLLENNLKLLFDSIHYVKQLDMKSVCKGDMSTIKERVSEARMGAIMRAFKFYGEVDELVIRD